MKKITFLFLLFCIALAHAQAPIISSDALRHNINPQLFVDFRISEEIDLTNPNTNVIISYQIKNIDGIYTEVYQKNKLWSGYLNTYPGEPAEGGVVTVYGPGYENDPKYLPVLPAGKTLSTSVSGKTWQAEGYLANLKVIITVIDSDGNSTSKELIVDETAPADFTAIAGVITPTSVELLLNSTDISGPITYDVTYDDGKTATITGVSGTQTSLIIGGLTPETAYSFSVTAKDAKGNITDPVLVNASTIAVPDTTAPTDFTAITGTITPTSVELLLNGTNASGPITYVVTYDGGKTATITGASGTQISLLINDLTPKTAYTFSITPKDATGKNITTEPILVNVTTTAPVTDTNTECAGTSSETIDGTPLTLGYNYSFTTTGTDVTMTFELLDTKDGLIAISWTQNNGLIEKQMTPAGSQKFTQTITGLTIGSQITYACKFAFAGGLSVTKYFTYTVGNTCPLTNNTNEFSKSVSLYPNPAKNILNIESSSSISKIEFYSVLGSKVLETTGNTNVVNIETLSKGIYMVKMYTENNESAIKKLIVE